MSDIADPKDVLIAELRDRIQILEGELARERAKKSASSSTKQYVSLAALMGAIGSSEDLENRRKEIAKDQEELIESGLHLLAEGIRLFLELHPTLTADGKTAQIKTLAQLEEDLRELVRERDDKKSEVRGKES
jgi:hypothetical protein